MWCLTSFINCLCCLIQQNNICCSLSGDHDPLGADEAACAFGEVMGRMAQLRVIR